MPLKALPEPKNIYSSIVIPVQNKTTVRTGMNTGREVFRNLGPATGAELRGISGWYPNNQAASLFRFAPEYAEEPKPGSISHLLGKAMILPIPGIHVLDVDDVIGFEKLIGNFKVEISSLVGNLLMGFGHKEPGFLPPRGAFPSSREPLLPHSKHSMGFVKMAGVSYLNPIGGSEERFKPNINSYLFASFGQWFFGDIIARKAGIPFAGRGFSDSDGLNVALNRPGEPEFEGSKVSDGEILALKPPAGLLQGKGIIPVFALEPWKAGFLSTPNSAKETLEGSIKSLQNILEGLRVYLFVLRKCVLKLRKLSLLLGAGDRVMPLLKEASALLKGGIIEASAKVKPAFGPLKSLRSGFNTILKGFSHLPCTNRIIAKIERAFITPPEGVGFPARYSIRKEVA